MQHTYVYKVMLVGDSGVGKSTILSSYRGERFNPCYVQTREGEIKKANIQVGKTAVELQIWDTPGNTVTAAYSYMCDDVKGVIFVFDVTALQTYINVIHWVTTFKQYAGDKHVKFVFVGNKTDVGERKVLEEFGQQLAKQHKGVYIDASAKKNQNIDQIFKEMALSIHAGVESEKHFPGIMATDDLLFKLLMIGDSSVGKTCVLNRFSKNAFKPGYFATRGVEFDTKIIELYGIKIKLQIRCGINKIIASCPRICRSHQTMAMHRRIGVPTDGELLDLSSELGAKWKNLARALGVPEASIEVVDEESRKVLEKSYNLLLLWKQGRGSQATYAALEAGLCHGVVLRRDLAEKYCYAQAMPQENVG